MGWDHLSLDLLWHNPTSTELGQGLGDAVGSAPS